jgi:hypothetical protein
MIVVCHHLSFGVLEILPLERLQYLGNRTDELCAEFGQSRRPVANNRVIGSSDSTDRQRPRSLYRIHLQTRLNGTLGDMLCVRRGSLSTSAKASGSSSCDNRDSYNGGSHDPSSLHTPVACRSFRS